MHSTKASECSYNNVCRYRPALKTSAGAAKPIGVTVADITTARTWTATYDPGYYGLSIEIVEVLNQYGNIRSPALLSRL
jgi:hypothetical protein